MPDLLSEKKEGEVHVARCPGGKIHLSWGRITLHLSEKEFLSLSAQLVQVAQELRAVDALDALKWGCRSRLH